MALQFRRYKGSQIFAFDFGGSIRAAALGMGGDWQDLGGALHAEEGDSAAVALQPLARRSEEHTSELQSLMRISYAVFRLKKKKNKINTIRRATNDQNSTTTRDNTQTTYNKYQPL